MEMKLSCKKVLSIALVLTMILSVLIPCGAFVASAEEELVLRKVDFSAEKWTSNAKTLTFVDSSDTTQAKIAVGEDSWLANAYITAPVDVSKEFSFTFSLDDFANGGRYAFRLNKTAAFANWTESACYDANGLVMGGTWYTEGYLQVFGGGFRNCGAAGDFTFTVSKGAEAWNITMANNGVVFETMTVPFSAFAADTFTGDKAYLYLYSLNSNGSGEYEDGQFTFKNMTNYTLYTAPKIKKDVDFSAENWASNAKTLTYTDTADGTQAKVIAGDDCWLANGYIKTQVDVSKEFSFTFSLDDYANCGRYAFRLNKTAAFANWNESTCYDDNGLIMGGTWYTEGYLQVFGGGFRNCGAAGDFTFTVSKGAEAWNITMANNGTLFETMSVPFTALSADAFTNDKAYLYIYNLCCDGSGVYQDGQFTIKSMTHYENYSIPKAAQSVDCSADKWISNAETLTFTDADDTTQANVAVGEDSWLANAYLKTPVDVSEKFTFTFTLDDYANCGRYAFRLNKTAAFANWTESACYDDNGLVMGGTWYTEGYLQVFGGAFRNCGASGEFTFTVAKGSEAWTVTMANNGRIFETMTVSFSDFAADSFTGDKAYLYLYNLNANGDGVYENGQFTFKSMTEYTDKTADVKEVSVVDFAEENYAILKVTVDDYFVEGYGNINADGSDAPMDLISTVSNKLLINGKSVAALNNENPGSVECSLAENDGKQQFVLKIAYSATDNRSLYLQGFTLEVLKGAVGSEGMFLSEGVYQCYGNSFTTALNANTIALIRQQLLRGITNISLDMNKDGQYNVLDLINIKKALADFVN